MRDCIFLLADKNMEATFIGFLTREQFHLSLGIRQFEFDIAEDLIVDESGNDPGVYTRAHEFLRPYQRTHRYAVIVLDNAWEGSPGVATIENNIFGCSIIRREDLLVPVTKDLPAVHLCGAVLSRLP